MRPILAAVLVMKRNLRDSGSIRESLSVPGSELEPSNVLRIWRGEAKQ
jgi:hypothetical protein